MHTYAIIRRGGGALYALIDVFNNENKCSFFPFEPFPKAKLKAKQFIMFTSVLDFLLQGQNQIVPTVSRWFEF